MRSTAWALVLVLGVFLPGQQDEVAAGAAAAAIDAYVDQRCEGTPAATQQLLQELAELGIDDAAAIEALLRAPRHAYPDVGNELGRFSEHDVACYHVDYASKYRLFVPAGYTHDQPAALVVVGHGGNSSMSPARAARVARSYLSAYAPTFAKDLQALVVAPYSSRGWGHIGNSLILSTISDLQRRYRIDPDRIFVTGHSMGGHMAFRAALSLGDRFGAVSPHSGGYDFVAKQAIASLANVPGYVTWGEREPYGIRGDNRTNRDWATAHGLDWVFREKQGGHEIFGDELPAIARFFAAHPRDLYRDVVYLRAGGAMKFVKTWGIDGWPEHVVRHETRPLRWNVRHWLEVVPRPDHDGALTALGRYVGGNRFELVTDGVRELGVYLHPKMVDLAEPVVIVVNGEVCFEGRVEPDLAQMLELVREFDDRGRIFWARVPVTVASDREVEVTAETFAKR